MNTEKHRDLESEREELIQIMVKNRVKLIFVILSQSENTIRIR